MHKNRRYYPTLWTSSSISRIKNCLYRRNSSSQRRSKNTHPMVTNIKEKYKAKKMRNTIACERARWVCRSYLNSCCFDGWQCGNSSISLGPLKHTFWIVAATMGLNSPSRIRKYSLRICFYLKSYDDSVPVRIPKQLHDIRHIQKRIDVPARMHF